MPDALRLDPGLFSADPAERFAATKRMQAKLLRQPPPSTLTIGTYARKLRLRARRYCPPIHGSQSAVLRVPAAPRAEPGLALQAENLQNLNRL